MKFTLLAIVTFAAVLALVSADADAGHFIPKAFYKLDEEGHKLNLSPVSPHTVQYLRRLRRQASSSSSSSSSVSSDGGPVYFSSQQGVHHTPGLGVGLASRFGEASGSTSSSSSIQANGGPVYFSNQESVHHSGDPVGLASRFGGNSSSGKIVQTTGVVDKDGIVHYKTSTTNL